MRIPYKDLLRGSQSLFRQGLLSPSASNTAENWTPLKSKVSQVLNKAIDDKMILGMIEPLLLSMSDDELRQMLQKTHDVIERVLSDNVGTIEGGA